jgi:hypothetical protein
VFFDYVESEGGNFILTMYDSATLGHEIGTYAKTFKGNPQLLVAKVAAWVLAMEMEYINENMPKAFVDIWKFNPASTSKLKIYAVFVDANPYEGLAGAKGIKFYYYDEGQNSWINYYNDMVYWKVEFKPEEISPGIAEAEEFVTPEVEEETTTQIEQDGGKIVYTSGNEIYTINTDGSC